MNIDFFGTPEKRVKYGKADHLVQLIETSRISKITPELVDEFLNAHAKLDLDLIEKFGALDRNTVEKFPEISANIVKLEKVLENIRKIDSKLLEKITKDVTVDYNKLYDHFWKNVANTVDFKRKFQGLVDGGTGKETSRLGKHSGIKAAKHLKIYKHNTK